MKEGYITEIFSSFQGEGPYAGRRQIFVRLAGCPLSCSYCDTAYARDPKPRFCTVFGTEDPVKRNDGSNSFGQAFLSKKRLIENPMPSAQVTDILKELNTPDLHSIAYTGGEPLLSASFVKAIAEETKKSAQKNFIETNGYSATAFASIAEYFDFASIDIKLRHHQAVEEKDYGNLYRNALDCIKIAVDKGIEAIVKVVVLKNTSKEELERICRDFSDLSIKFVLQPVTVPPHQQNADIVPSMEELFMLSETAGRFLDDVLVLPQLHKIMHIR